MFDSVCWLVGVSEIPEIVSVPRIAPPSPIAAALATMFMRTVVVTLKQESVLSWSKMSVQVGIPAPLAGGSTSGLLGAPGNRELNAVPCNRPWAGQGPFLGTRVAFVRLKKRRAAGDPSGVGGWEDGFRRREVAVVIVDRHHSACFVDRYINALEPSRRPERLVFNVSAMSVER